MIEQKVADTILSKELSYEIGGEIYKVSPPSCGTIIELSALASGLPEMTIKKDDDVLALILKHAKDCGAILDVASLLVLGYNGKTGVRNKKILFFNVKQEYDRFSELKERMRAKSPRFVENLIGEILIRSEVDIFFQITTSLKEANILKPTKGVVTASGR